MQVNHRCMIGAGASNTLRRLLVQHPDQWMAAIRENELSGARTRAS
jgi:hypothetical protein